MQSTVPIGRASSVLSALLALACAPADSTGISFDGDRAELATERVGNHEMVSVYVGDDGPYRFIVDTGSPVNVIDSRIVAQLGLPALDRTTVKAPGGKPVNADIVALPRLSIGHLTIDNTEAVSLDIETMSSGMLQGVIGMGNFRDLTLAFEPARHRIIVSRTRLSPDMPGALQYDGSEGQFQVELDVDGRKVAAHIDTGSPSGFTLPVALRDELPLSSEPTDGPTAKLVGGSRRVQTATLAGTVRLGDLEFRNPRIAFMDPMPGHANIGMEVLRNYILTLDQASVTVALSRPQAQSPAARTPRGDRRLGLRLRGMSGEALRHVAGVDPGSLAEQAGFSAGDTLISINGRATDEFDVRELATLLRGHDALLFAIERDGTTIELEIQ